MEWKSRGNLFLKSILTINQSITRDNTNYKMIKSKLSSIFSLTCPACRTGALFPNSSLFFDFSFKMNSRCPHCNESFIREPGFYYGAMFISYIFSAFFSLLFAGILILIFDIDWKLVIAMLILVMILTFAYLFKVSRSIWIHFFVPFKKS